MQRPITPQELKATKQTQIPPIVFEVFNQLISAKFDGHQAAFQQEEVIKLLVKTGLNKGDIFAKHLLDIEPHYREAGWSVVYDKPGYNEDYPATFTFTAK